jgi:type II secretory pathway component PulF
VRKDLFNARAVLEDHGSFGDAFAEPALLNDRIKGFIATGAISGHLGSSLDRIVQSETLDLENTLQKVNRVVQILVAYGVAMSIVGTLLFVLLSMPGR